MLIHSIPLDTWATIIWDHGGRPLLLQWNLSLEAHFYIIGLTSVTSSLNESSSLVNEHGCREK